MLNEILSELQAKPGYNNCRYITRNIHPTLGVVWTCQRSMPPIQWLQFRGCIYYSISAAGNLLIIEVDASKGRSIEKCIELLEDIGSCNEPNYQGVVL